MNGDRVKCAVTAGGTGALTLGAAVSGFRTPASIGLGASGGQVNYLVEWTGGWCNGVGTLSTDGLTFTRLYEYASSATDTVKTTGPFESVPGSGGVFSIGPDSRSGAQSTSATVYRAPLVKSLECLAIGGWSTIGTGANGSISIGGTVADNAIGSIAIGNGGVNAPGGIAVGFASADQYGEFARGLGGTGTKISEFSLGGTTTNATPTDLFLDSAGTLRPQVPGESAWLVIIKVMAMISNSPGQIGSIYARELRVVAKPTGQVGSTVSTAIASDAGFTGSATASVDGSGHIKVTVTGMASNTINWVAHLAVTPVLSA